MASEKKLQNVLNSAEGDDAVLEALAALLPLDELSKFKSFQSHKDRRFLRQLDFIKTGVVVKTNAVRHYLMSERMRIRWRAKKLSDTKLSLLRNEMMTIYQRHFDANREGKDTSEVRGRRTFNDTVQEANTADSVRIPGGEKAIELPIGTIEGEYHHMADGENGVKLGWHPEWKRKLETGAFHD